MVERLTIIYAEKILEHAPEGHILELSAGPGYLAKHLLERCPYIKYTAFDFSDAMHELPKNKLISSELVRCQCIAGDFKQPEWEEALQKQGLDQHFDVIIIHQALHELRHKHYALGFHQSIQSLKNAKALYFVCDH